VQRLLVTWRGRESRIDKIGRREKSEKQSIPSPWYLAKIATASSYRSLAINHLGLYTAIHKVSSHHTPYIIHRDLQPDPAQNCILNVPLVRTKPK
jgi:hypothetical protein